MHALRIVPPSGGAPRAALAVSASQLKDLDRCERAWYLASVAHAPDDGEAGGQYLLQGDLYDVACQNYQARLDVGVDDLIAAVRAKPGLRGAALTLDDAKWRELAERAQRMLRATQRFLPAPKTARIQHRYRVFVPGYEDRGGVVITGTCDFRDPRGGVVWDTKTTADRGRGRGRDAATPPYALNETTLAADVQARLYAWCEFMLDPDRAFVRCIWVYASKASPMSPDGWAVEVTFSRYDTIAWFANYVRPRLDRMVELHLASEIELDAGLARANHDGCVRCFRRGACDPFSGLQAHFRGEEEMVDFAKLRARQSAGGTPAAAFGAGSFHAPTPSALTLEAAAVAGGTQDDRRADVAPSPNPSAVAPSAAEAGATAQPTYGDGRAVLSVAINRPEAPLNPHAPSPGDRAVVFGSREPRQFIAGAAFPGQAIIETSGHEAPEAAAPLPPPDAAETVLALLTPAEAATVAAPAAPKRGRGRPRKHPQQHEADGSVATPSGDALAGAAVPSAGASVLDAEALERLATAWQRVADAADAAVAVVNAELRARGVKL